MNSISITAPGLKREKIGPKTAMTQAEIENREAMSIAFRQNAKLLFKWLDLSLRANKTYPALELGATMHTLDPKHAYKHVFARYGLWGRLGIARKVGRVELTDNRDKDLYDIEVTLRGQEQSCAPISPQDVGKDKQLLACINGINNELYKLIQ